MRLIALSFIGAAAIGCDSSPVPHAAILGNWKSNEELTLRSMNKIGEIDSEVRKYLDNDFFGHLEVEWLRSTSRAVNPKDEFDTGFEPYEVLEVTPKYIKVRVWSSILEDYDESTMYLEGNCYYVITSKYEFREYFCRQG
jgi:hypothetical protein